MSDDLPDAETRARRLHEAMEHVAELEEKLATRATLTGGPNAKTAGPNAKPDDVRNYAPQHAKSP